MKEKLKSYSFWSALSGAIVIFVNALGKIFGFSVEDELISGLIMAIAGILVVFGVVTMPNNKEETKNNSSQQESKLAEEKNSSEAEKKDDEK